MGYFDKDILDMRRDVNLPQRAMRCTAYKNSKRSWDLSESNRVMRNWMIVLGVILGFLLTYICYLAITWVFEAPSPSWKLISIDQASGSAISYSPPSSARSVTLTGSGSTTPTLCRDRHDSFRLGESYYEWNEERGEYERVVFTGGKRYVVESTGLRWTPRPIKVGEKK